MSFEEREDPRPEYVYEFYRRLSSPIKSTNHAFDALTYNQQHNPQVIYEGVKIRPSILQHDEVPIDVLINKNFQKEIMFLSKDLAISLLHTLNRRKTSQSQLLDLIKINPTLIEYTKNLTGYLDSETIDIYNEYDLYISGKKELYKLNDCVYFNEFVYNEIIENVKNKIRSQYYIYESFNEESMLSKIAIKNMNKQISQIISKLNKKRKNILKNYHKNINENFNLTMNNL